jgi:hypothetical protein
MQARRRNNSTGGAASPGRFYLIFFSAFANYGVLHFERAASTMLGNSAMSPSPVRFTIRRDVRRRLDRSDRCAARSLSRQRPVLVRTRKSAIAAGAE